MKLAIISTHPIQYNAPFFRLLHEKSLLFETKVFYTWSQWQVDKFDVDFHKEIIWDVPLLEGYDYEFIENRSRKPSLKSFYGVKTPSLIHKIEEWGTTHVLVYGWNYQSHFKLMRHFKNRIPVWFRGDSTLLDYPIISLNDLTYSSISIGTFTQLVKYQIRRLLLCYIYHFIDIAFYVGINNKKYFLSAKIPLKKLQLAPHSIDNSRFQKTVNSYREDQIFEFRKKLGFRIDDIVILFAGKFESKKNPIGLMKAFLNSQKKRTVDAKNLKLLFVGDGIQKDELLKLGHGSEDIVFLPFQNQNDMPLMYSICDVYCLPSIGPGETWGLAINEAMACGKPIISTNMAGGTPNLVVNNLNGFIYIATDSTHLEDIILSLNKNRLCEMGKESLNIIERFSYSQFITVISQQIMK